MKFQYLFSQKKQNKQKQKKTEKIKIRMSPATNFAWRFKGKLHNIIHLFVVKLSYFIINEFLAYLNNVHGELLYYPLVAAASASTNIKVFVKVFKTSLFPNLITDLIYLWFDDTYWSKILRNTIPTILGHV